MKKLIRTDKEISKANLSEEFIRKACSIGGKHSIPLKADFEKFTINDKYINQRIDGTGSQSPYDGYVYGCVKYLDAVEIKLSGFDTTTIIWQNGKIQGYYDDDKLQYAADPIGWTNLLLEYEFLKIIDLK